MINNNKDEETGDLTPSSIFSITINSEPDEHKLMGLTKQFYSRLTSVFLRERDKATQNQYFYNGYQLTSQKESALEKMNKIPIVVNHIRVAMDTLTGRLEYDFQRPKFKPILNTDNKKIHENVELLNKILAYYYEKLSSKNHLLDAFRTGCIQGRSILQICYDGSKLFLKLLNAISSMLDPYTNKIDLSDSNFIWKTINVPKDILIAQYPEKQEVIKNSRILYDIRNVNQSVMTDIQNDTTVSEIYVKDYDNINNEGSGHTYCYKFLAGTSEKLGYSVLPFSTFPFVLFSPNISNFFSSTYSRFLSLVENAISIQQQYNTTLRTILDMMECSINSMFLFLQTALQHPEAIDAVTTGCLRVRDTGFPIDKIIHKVPSNQIPGEYIQTLQILEEKIYQSLFVDNPSGVEKSNESVTASMIETKEKRQNISIGNFRQNFDDFHQSYAKKLVKIVLEVAIYNENQDLIKRDIQTANENSDHGKNDVSITKLSKICDKEITPELIGELYETIEDCSVVFMYGEDSPIGNLQLRQDVKELTELGIKLPINFILQAFQVPDAEKVAQQIQLQEKQAAELQSREMDIKQSLAVSKIHLEKLEGIKLAKELQTRKQDVETGNEQKYNDENFSNK